MADADAEETITIDEVINIVENWYATDPKPKEKAHFRDEQQKIVDDFRTKRKNEIVKWGGKTIVDDEGEPVLGSAYADIMGGVIGKGSKGGSQASGVIQAIMAKKKDYLSQLTQKQLNIVGEHFDVDKKVRRRDGEKRKYVRRNHSALQIREQVDLEAINDFIKERFPDVRPKKYTLRDKLGKNYPDGRNQLVSKSVLKRGAEEGKEDYEENLRLYENAYDLGIDTYIRARHSDGRWIEKYPEFGGDIPYNQFFSDKYTMMNSNPTQMRGSGVPPERDFWKSVKYTYRKVAPNAIGDGYVKIVDTPTFDAYLRRSDKSILIGLRGTKITSWTDIKADAQIVANRLNQSKRYKRDVGILRKIIAQFPPEAGYEYYIAGHSLSVAIANQLMRDFPFIRYAVGYNGAFQPADLVQQNPDIKRLYTDKDFLYNLGGKFFRGVKVVPMTEKKARGFFDRIQSVLKPDVLKAHTLDNFKPLYGLGMKGRDKVRAVIEGIVEKKGGGAKDPSTLEKMLFAPGRDKGKIRRINEWWEDIIDDEIRFSTDRFKSIARIGNPLDPVPLASALARAIKKERFQGSKGFGASVLGRIEKLIPMEKKILAKKATEEETQKYILEMGILTSKITRELIKDLKTSISAAKRRDRQLAFEEKQYQERLEGFRKGWIFGTAYVSLKQGIQKILSKPHLRKAFFSVWAKGLGLLPPPVGPILEIIIQGFADDPNFNLGDFLAEMFKMGAGKFFEYMAEYYAKKHLPPGVDPKMAKFITMGAKQMGSKLGREGADVVLDAIGKDTSKIDDKTKEVVKKVSEKTGGSKKSGYIASLITGKNKPMELSKFVKQSDAFKKYTLPQLLKEGVIKMDTQESKNLADEFFTKAGKLRKGTDLGRLIGEFAEDTFADKMIRNAKRSSGFTPDQTRFLDRVESHLNVYKRGLRREKPDPWQPNSTQLAYEIFKGNDSISALKKRIRRQNEIDYILDMFKRHYPMSRRGYVAKVDRVYIPEKRKNEIVFRIGEGRFKKPSIPLQILDFLGVDKVVDMRGGYEYGEEPEKKSWNKSAFKKSKIPKIMERAMKDAEGY